VRDRAAVEAVPAALPAEFAALDVLVNNAGLRSVSSRPRTPASTNGTR
jgi:NADP-dependent 3-hydroxy acid dehydrogenase YdfG